MQSSMVLGNEPQPHMTYGNGKSQVGHMDQTVSASPVTYRWLWVHSSTADEETRASVDAALCVICTALLAGEGYLY
jgi:hypothetical protein